MTHAVEGVQDLRLNMQLADYLMEKFREAGLVNVTKDPCNVDKWVFEEAKLTYTDSSGAIHEVILGGYASLLQRCGVHYGIRRTGHRGGFKGHGCEWQTGSHRHKSG